MNNDNHIYELKLTEKQAKFLSYACDQYSRLICGQDFAFQDLMEQAWERNAKKHTGNMMHKDWEGGWQNMREDAEAICKQIKKRFWHMEWNAHYGIGYDEMSDILFDISQVIRHQLWLDRPNDRKNFGTVDAFPAHRHGNERLAEIKRINEK